jgi:CBS domain-containing protein
MKVKECMSRDVKMVRPDLSIGAAAKLMSEKDVGFLPVGDDDRLRGIITDRDIAVRAVAHAKDHNTPVSEVMSAEVMYCFDDQDIGEVAENMAKIQVRRLPVVDRDKRLVGIISLADAARRETETAGRALHGVVQPGGQHTQAA